MSINILQIKVPKYLNAREGPYVVVILVESLNTSTYTPEQKSCVLACLLMIGYIPSGTFSSACDSDISILFLSFLSVILSDK